MEKRLRAKARKNFWWKKFYLDVVIDDPVERKEAEKARILNAKQDADHILHTQLWKDRKKQDLWPKLRSEAGIGNLRFPWALRTWVQVL